MSFSFFLGKNKLSWDIVPFLTLLRKRESERSRSQIGNFDEVVLVSFTFLWPDMVRYHPSQEGQFGLQSGTLSLWKHLLWITSYMVGESTKSNYTNFSASYITEKKRPNFRLNMNPDDDFYVILWIKNENVFSELAVITAAAPPPPLARWSPPTAAAAAATAAAASSRSSSSLWCPTTASPSSCWRSEFYVTWQR